MPTTVLIADDHDGFRIALASLLGATDDLVVIGSACGGAEAIDLAAALHPHVVVMDLMMPGVNGVEATRTIRNCNSSNSGHSASCSQGLAPAVVALSGSRELMRDAIAAGAAFAVLKEEEPERLIAVVRAAAASGEGSPANRV
jgi:DNA-binding NarL/FixJ family response regulator